MYDIHSHLLPGIDDGPSDWTESLELAQAAVDEGIDHIILTPHHRNGMWNNERDQVLTLGDEFKNRLAQAGLEIDVLISQEVQINPNYLKEFQAGSYLPLDSRGNYYLVEFPWGETPDYAESYLKQMVDEGVTPIIAHPERQRAFRHNLPLLHRLIDLGCLAQLTASSLVGSYGDEIRIASHNMLKQGLVHLLASDSHNTYQRPFNLQAGYQILAESYGEAQVQRFLDNAAKVYHGETLVNG
ncbi:tyrosine-protein phosphatase [Hutsoniella sourekii]